MALEDSASGAEIVSHEYKSRTRLPPRHLLRQCEEQPPVGFAHAGEKIAELPPDVNLFPASCPFLLPASSADEAAQGVPFLHRTK